MAGSALERMSRAAARIDAVNVWFGRASGVLTYALLIAIMAHVVMRYFFNLNLIYMEEIHWHLYAAAFMLSLGYANVTGSHIRVDLFYEAMSRRARAWVNLLGAVVLLSPFCAVLTCYCFEYFWASWSIREASQQPGALPARYILKFLMPLGILLLGTQAVSIALRALVTLFGGADDDPGPDPASFEIG